MEEIMWKHTHLCDVTELTVSDVEWIISYAKVFRGMNAGACKSLDILKGKNIVLFFAENSTRTRLSFEIAAQRLGATTHSMQKAGSSMQKGETIRDTILTLQAMRPDAFVMRSEYSGASEYVRQFITVPVLNAGDGWHAHPSQALLDLLTLHTEWNGEYANKIVTIIGDTKHSRVARSDIHLLHKLGITVRICGPKTLTLQKDAFPYVQFFTNINDAVDGADAIIALRLQLERQEAGLVPKEYYSVYGVTEQVLEKAKPSAIVLHPGPINPSIDIDPMLAIDPQRSRICTQVENGVAVRMALLYLFCNTGKKLPRELHI